MALKHIVELNEKELKEIICKNYGLEKDTATIRISQIDADYGQGTHTAIIVEAKEIEKLKSAIRGITD